MTATYSATPATQSYSPSKTFASIDAALQYAADAARTFHVEYAVWMRFPTLRKVRTFQATTKE